MDAPAAPVAPAPAPPAPAAPVHLVDDGSAARSWLIAIAVGLVVGLAVGVILSRASRRVGGGEE